MISGKAFRSTQKRFAKPAAVVVDASVLVVDDITKLGGMIDRA
jgi:hypothetical protein